MILPTEGGSGTAVKTGPAARAGGAVKGEGGAKAQRGTERRIAIKRRLSGQPLPEALALVPVAEEVAMAQ